MLWTQILYLIMVSVNLLQGWNINDVTLPCEGRVQPISPGQPAWGGFPLSSPGSPRSSVVSVQSLGWLCSSQSQLTGCWIFSLQSGSQPIACTLESASHHLQMVLAVPQRSFGVAVGQIRWPDREHVIISSTGAHFPSKSKVFLLSRLLHSSVQHEDFFSEEVALFYLALSIILSHIHHETYLTVLQNMRRLLAPSLARSPSLNRHTRCFLATLSQGLPLISRVPYPR